MNNFHSLLCRNSRDVNKIFIILIIVGFILFVNSVSAQNQQMKNVSNNTTIPSKIITPLKKLIITPIITPSPIVKVTPLLNVQNSTKTHVITSIGTTISPATTPVLTSDEMRTIEIAGKDLPLLLQRLDDSRFYFLFKTTDDTLTEYDSIKGKFDAINKEAEGLKVRESFEPLRFDILNGTSSISNGLTLKETALTTTLSYDSELLSNPMNMGIINGYLSSGDKQIDDGRFRLQAAKMKIYYLAPWYSVPVLPEGTSLFDWTFEGYTPAPMATQWGTY